MGGNEEAASSRREGEVEIERMLRSADEGEEEEEEEDRKEETARRALCGSLNAATALESAIFDVCFFEIGV